MKKVVITRLRNSEYYKGEPLNHIVDSMYHLLDNFIEKNDDWPPTMDTHNCSLPSREKSRKTIRDYQRIKDADVLIIPSEAEFAYNIYGRISNFQMGRTWGLVQYLREALLENPKPRKVILLSSDKADTIELYRDKVFKMIPNLTFYRIDESEFPGGIHHLKYLNIKKLNLDTTKKKDFGYWGTSKRFKIDMTSEMKDYNIKDYFKDGEIVRYGTDGAELKTKFVEPMFIGKESKDKRHIILKQINGDESISNNLIGYFEGFKYTHKFDKNMTNILPYIAECKYTLCFNWPGQEEHLTSRYNEALACDTIPLVWEGYDSKNQLVADNWQRCFSFQDIKHRLSTPENLRIKKLEKIKKKYEEVTKDLEYYEDLFNQKLMGILND
jgi:hypothetical protein|tara:strand:+ start:3152 stop:4300 length:1149 start_codon:yes stop_codon:yes gene_type:complete